MFKLTTWNQRPWPLQWTAQDAGNRLRILETNSTFQKKLILYWTINVELEKQKARNTEILMIGSEILEIQDGPDFIYKKPLCTLLFQIYSWPPKLKFITCLLFLLDSWTCYKNNLNMSSVEWVLQTNFNENLEIMKYNQSSLYSYTLDSPLLVIGSTLLLSFKKESLSPRICDRKYAYKIQFQTDVLAYDIFKNIENQFF